ncbi:predicted protein [Postia placenta Mad-698-R]|uniref:Uncharacterized protein n=1 Tax=Postia placenta MAD-698-R-SB12 TaxID=670580 RepID=A0A1X6N3H4_9APHY|nr:hypothetical protein POSPLADRAFT_1045599 [Postia placenta MAD-698-R-SB12]EED78226.1 predicted protein [Postia placenta Mad-698-R]OSX63164.1 hypothetical protein POSPLADRAFT_1045599 [Postia placenta MAD-698-R-SB12]
MSSDAFTWLGDWLQGSTSTSAEEEISLTATPATCQEHHNESDAPGCDGDLEGLFTDFDWDLSPRGSREPPSSEDLATKEATIGINPMDSLLWRRTFTTTQAGSTSATLHIYRTFRYRQEDGNTNYINYGNDDDVFDAPAPRAPRHKKPRFGTRKNVIRLPWSADDLERIALTCAGWTRAELTLSGGSEHIELGRSSVVTTRCITNIRHTVYILTMYVACSEGQYNLLRLGSFPSDDSLFGDVAEICWHDCYDFCRVFSQDNGAKWPHTTEAISLAERAQLLGWDREHPPLSTFQPRHPPKPHPCPDFEQNKMSQQIELPVFVAQYSNTQDTAWHWEIVVKTNPWVKGTGQAVGEAFHIKGATQAIFTYERKQNVKYGSPSSFKGCVLVGHINATALDAADQLLSTVPIVNGNHNWNCQNWVVLAISALENQGRAFFKLKKGRPVKQVDLLAKMVPLATAYDAVVQSEDEL